MRCPQRRQRQRVTEGTAMAPWNGPKNGDCRPLQINVKVDVCIGTIATLAGRLKLSDQCRPCLPVGRVYCLIAVFSSCTRVAQSSVLYQRKGGRPVHGVCNITLNLLSAISDRNRNHRHCRAGGGAAIAFPACRRRPACRGAPYITRPPRGACAVREFRY